MYNLKNKNNNTKKNIDLCRNLIKLDKKITKAKENLDIEKEKLRKHKIKLAIKVKKQNE